jgi:hypothetical protein
MQTFAAPEGTSLNCSSQENPCSSVQLAISQTCNKGTVFLSGNFGVESVNHTIQIIQRTDLTLSGLPPFFSIFDCHGANLTSNKVLFIESSHMITIRNITFRNCVGFGGVAATIASNSTVTFENCTFQNNTAIDCTDPDQPCYQNSIGGAVITETDTQVSFNSCTVTNNKVDQFFFFKFA